LTTSANLQAPSGVTPDGARLLFIERGPSNDNDVMQVEVAGSRTVTPLVQNAIANNGVVSPDGRWLAYAASDSGALEIYVRPYPDVNSGRWQVSTTGGRMPLWSHDGQELFYVSPANALMRVGVERGSSWTATTPLRVLPDGAVWTTPNSPLRTYDVTPDGQRFLVLKEPTGAGAAPQVVVIQHVDQLLKGATGGR
jgi:eukaryotic-like serine/threonine-protein kinase